MSTVTTATLLSRENFGAVLAHLSVSLVTSILHSFRKALFATCDALSAASMIYVVSGFGLGLHDDSHPMLSALVRSAFPIV